MAFSKPKAHERAERYAAKGQHDKAAREYQAIVEHDPKDIRAWLMLADCLVRCDDRPGAIERYIRVAQYYGDAKEYNKALAVYRQVLNLDGQRLDIQIKVASLNLAVGQVPDGIALYERVAQAQLQLGRVGDALATYKIVADADETAVSRRLRLAELYSREKKVPEAVEAFRQAGDQLRTVGRTADYVRVAERLLFHDERDLVTLRQLARAYLELGDPRRALMKLNGLLRSNPTDEEGIELLAETFMGLGKPEKALSALEELARALRAKGPDAKTKTIRILRRGLQWRPGHAEFREALSELEGRRRSGAQSTVANDEEEIDFEDLDEDDLVELDEADVVIEEATIITVDEPSTPMSLPEAGTTAPGTRRTAEVEALPSVEPSLTQSVLSEVQGEGSPEIDALTDFDKILYEARVYIKYRLFEHALDHVQTALGQQPQHVGALSLRARALTELGRVDEAAGVHVEVAELVMARDPKLAREHIGAARALVPNDPRVTQLSDVLGNAPAVASPEPPVEEDDGDSGAFDLVSEGFEDLVADASRPSVAPPSDVQSAEESTQPFSPVDLSEASSATVGSRETTPPAGFVPARPPSEAAQGAEVAAAAGPAAHHVGPNVGLPLDDSPTPGPMSAEPPPEALHTPSERTLVGNPAEAEAPPARTGRTNLHIPAADEPLPGTTPPSSDGDEVEVEIEIDAPTSPTSTAGLLERAGAQGAEGNEGEEVDELDELDFDLEADDDAVPPAVEPAQPIAAAPQPAEPQPAEPQPAEPLPVEPEPAATAEWADISDDLAEVRFYLDQGLDDDAEAALADLERRNPGHPDLRTFRGDPDEVPAPSLVEAEAAAPLVDVDETESLTSFDEDADEDAYLSAIFAAPAERESKPAGASAAGAGVAAGQSVDAATAFDLGVAYREMGLVDAAIAQFETAAIDEQWRARALTMLGTLRVHQGATDQAIHDLQQAVGLATTSDESSEAAYELGVLYEMLGDAGAAVAQLQQVAPGYRDRDQRLAELGA
ncbi:MAG: tetratricopeptide repeat protein [Deltaproteobacteria bacterium]|nr:tetratricopeptide repeat protein [Deltaproteobacteria bacterium]